MSYKSEEAIGVSLSTLYVSGRDLDKFIRENREYPRPADFNADTWHVVKVSAGPAIETPIGTKEALSDIRTCLEVMEQAQTREAIGDAWKNMSVSLVNAYLSSMERVKNK